jgi:O-antigen biosynthesis protein WbqP
MANDDIKNTNGRTGMSKKGRRLSAYSLIKRGLDVFFSAVLLLLLAFPMLLIWIAIRIDSPGAGFFRQERVGRDSKSFVCYKFRTMYINTPSNCPSSQLTDSQRYITRVGRLLRRTSLDELPQLFNVLKGNMSLVGPRPLIAQEHEVHDGRLRGGVYTLRPGITGLSQINGRDALSDEQKVLLDCEYLDRFGFFQDLKIVGLTLKKVVTGEGIIKK